MKKLIALTAALLLCLVTAVAFAAAQSIELDSDLVKVGVGHKSNPIIATVEPETEEAPALEWKSSNEQIATVDENGVVTGVKPGKCKVTVTVTGTSLKASCAVNVVQLVNAIKLNETELYMSKGSTSKLKATQSPSNADKRTVTWTTSDKAVATVKDGTVTAEGYGTCVITASISFSDGTELKAECTVSVAAQVTDLTLDKYSMTVYAGKTHKAPVVTVTPAAASGTKLEWSSENEKIATVDKETGEITGVKAGKVKIRVRTSKESGHRSASLTVTVVQPVTGITMKETLRIAVGKTASLGASVQPSDASNKQKTFKSSDTNVATVNDQGKVTAVSAGTCRITCTANDGAGAEAVCEVTVYQPVTKLTPGSTGTVTMTTGSTKTLPVAVSPADATDSSLTWTSDNEAIVTVDQGVATAVAAGTCTVRCETNDGTGLKASFTIEVEPAQPVSILSVRREASYGGDEECLFVTPVNNCVSKTVKSFIIHVTLYNEAGEIQHVYACEWTSTFGSIKPGQTGDSGYWHWYNLKDLMNADHITVAVTSVTFADGTKQTIEAGSREVKEFRFD